MFLADDTRTSFEISPTESIPVLPNIYDIEEAVIQSGADTVVLASGHLTSDELRDLSCVRTISRLVTW